MSYRRLDQKAETIAESDGETIGPEFHLIRGCHGLSYARRDLDSGCVSV